MSNPINIIYNQLSVAAANLETTPKNQQFGCPPGCGICCLGFDPDITRPELEVVSDYLAIQDTFDPLIFAPWDSQQKTCRFFRPDSPFHCSIYQVRPLVCRTFGYTASRNKNSVPVFTFCKIMPTDGSRRLIGNEISEKLGCDIPLAEDAGTLINSLNPTGERFSLSESIGVMVQFRRYRLQYSNDEPDPNNPIPPEVPPKAA